jgi:hypothetical protein
MRKPDWIISGFSILFCGTVAFSAAGPAVRPDWAERIRIQEARLPQIEAVAAQDREQVEQWYKVRRAAVVQETARRAAARLTLAQRELWVQFADLYLEKLYAPAYFNSGFISSYEAAVLGNAMIQEYLLSEMADILVNGEFERKLVQIVEERWDVPLLPLRRDRAAELLSLVRQVRAELTVELGHLGNQRNARLDAIMEWERDLKEQVRGILEYLRQSESRPVQFGVVESVGHCVNSGYFCMIEGVDRVLGMGDTIGKVRILKIDPEKVEFAKDGTTWAQPLGAPPQPFWD